MADPVEQFVREALAAGHGRDEVRGALTRAGWSPREIEEGLSAWADEPFSPPIPRPRAQVRARDFFVYSLLFVALAFTAGYLISLINAQIELAFPDPADRRGTYGPRRDILWAVAVLVISTPVWIWMQVLTSRWIRRDPGHRRSAVRRWLIYLTLLVTALIVFADAAYVVYAWLTGEATTRFLLQAATVAAVTAAIFVFYWRGLRGPGADEG